MFSLKYLIVFLGLLLPLFDGAVANETDAGCHPLRPEPSVPSTRILVESRVYDVPLKMKPELPKDAPIILIHQRGVAEQDGKIIDCERASKVAVVDHFYLDGIVIPMPEFLKGVDPKYQIIGKLDYVKITDSRVGNQSAAQTPAPRCYRNSPFSQSGQYLESIEAALNFDPRQQFNLRLADGPLISATCLEPIDNSRWCKARSMISKNTCVEISFWTRNAPLASVRTIFGLLGELINPMATAVTSSPQQ